MATARFLKFAAFAATLACATPSLAEEPLRSDSGARDYLSLHSVASDVDWSMLPAMRVHRHHKSLRHQAMRSNGGSAKVSLASAPVIVAAASPGPAGASEPRGACTGLNAWSLLCPGAQLLGASY